MIDDDIPTPPEPFEPTESVSTRDLAETLTPSPESLGYRLAEVVSIESNYSMTVKVAGSTAAVSGVRYLSHVAPQVGSSVWLMRSKEEWHGVGTMAHQAGWPACRVRRNSDTTAIASGAQLVSFDTAVTDNWDMWGSGTDVVIPFSGLWDFSGGAAWDADGTGFRSLGIYINGSVYVAYQRSISPSSGSTAILNVNSLAYPCVAGDVVTLEAAHTSTTNRYLIGGAQHRSYLSVAYRGPVGA